MNEDDGIWAMVVAAGGEYAYVKRSRIRFERDICFVVDPGKNIFEVIPKKIDRIDAVILVVATGFWHYGDIRRSEEHTSELQSLTNLVCRLLLEKKKNINN